MEITPPVAPAPLHAVGSTFPAELIDPLIAIGFVTIPSPSSTSQFPSVEFVSTILYALM